VQQPAPITVENPYVGVRWKPEDARVPIQLRGRPLFIPRRFEAGVVSASLHVVLDLEATAARKEIFEVAGHEPLQLAGDVLVMGVEVHTDRYLSFVTHEDFRRIPLKKWTRYAVAAAAGTRGELRQLTKGATADEWLKSVSFAELARAPVGRPRHGAMFMYRDRLIDLAEVNKVATTGAPHHVKAVQEHFGDTGHPVPRETARRWIKAARRAESHP
jgi:hypothetical protein